MAHIADHLIVAEPGRRVRIWDDAFASRHHPAIWPLTAGRAIGGCRGHCSQLGPDTLCVRLCRNGTASSPPTPALPDKLRNRLAELLPDGESWSTTKFAAWMAAELEMVSVHSQRT